MKALLLQLEFPTWKTARPWTYGASFAVAEGLAANGVTCLTVPVLPDTTAASPDSWLSHARRILSGQRFDQVWIWLVHASLDTRILEWAAELAPVRIGFFMESLRYEEEDYRWAPGLRSRHVAFHRQLEHLTHALMVDERDVAELTALGTKPALWCPGLVPRRFIADPSRAPRYNRAVFHGNVYGDRAKWIEHPLLRDRMTFAQAPAQYTSNQQKFDELQKIASERVRHLPMVTAVDLERYVRALHTVREAEFRDWLFGLADWAGIVNLPGLTRCFGGRVYEAMAAGRPVISWRIPDRPRVNALFEDNREILLFSPDDPADLAHQIDRILQDKSFAQAIGIQGQRKLLAHHTAERRMKDILQWLESGKEPEYGNLPTLAEQPTGVKSVTPVNSSSAPRPQGPHPISTTVFLLTVGDPTFRACQESVEQQTGATFKIETIQDVCPFSAAAQEMIARCTTPYFIQVDEDMVLHPDAVSRMERQIVQAPPEVGMICFHLFDEDRECPIQGIKIYRTASMKRLAFRDLKTSEMNLLDQMGEQGIRWILHPDILGRHGTTYTPESIYRRYKTMYEKDIRQWNLLTADIHRKANKFRDTGDILQLFALLGAAHGIIDAPMAPDREKDARAYHFKELEIFGRLLKTTPPVSQSYDFSRAAVPLKNPPIPFDQVQWKSAPVPLYAAVSRPTFEHVTQESVSSPKHRTAIASLPHMDSQSPAAPMPPLTTRVLPDEHRVHPTPVTTSHEGSMDQDQFYINMFVKSPGWSTSEPNDDEAARWSKIAGFLEHILRRVQAKNPDALLRILEVGSGRGWLSNLASQYGTVEGVEPVAGVVAHARKMFPHIRFEAGTAEAVLSRPDFTPYDVVLCSEVIEHVPDPEKPAFLEELKQLLTSDGYLILTTPRGEMWEQWQRIAPSCQPVEDWITEERLTQHMTAQGFTPLGLERIYVEIPTLRYIPAPTPHNLKTMNLLPIYQVWIAQRTISSPGQARPMINKPPMVSVIIPTHNRPDRLRTAITSVLNQDYHDFQIVVVNDGTAPVEDIVSGLNRDGRILLVTHDRNRGLAASRNTGLRQASGKYVCYLDDDDRFLPHHLRTLVTHLESSGDKVAYTDAWRVHESLIDNTATEIGRDQPYAAVFNPHQLLINNYLPVLCLMHERAVLDEVGAFDESLFVHEDWDLWIRMATRYPFKHLAVTTAEFTWRTDGSSMTSHRKDIFLRTMELIYRKYAPYAAKYAGVRENQQQNLTNLRTKPLRKSFVCSIIIPVWNKLELTRQCLVALGPATEDVSFELIVVDNHSTDGTPEFLASLGGDVRIITNDENLGFAKACNQGAAVATGEHLVFLNNDTIPLKGWLSALVDEVRTQPDVTVVGSKLLYQDGSIQHAGVAIDRHNLTPYHIYNKFAADHPAVNKRRELNAVTAACLLIRRTAFADLGGFDEGYLNGFEDVDLCLRVREKQGRIIYQPHSVLYHLESQTPGRKQHDRANANRLHLRWRHCWWLVDDDSIYVGDGYKAVGEDQNGIRSYKLQLIDSAPERQAWDLVASMQQAAHHQDLATVEAVLTRHAEWPADTSILQWAASVATAMKLPGIAEEYRRRIASLNDPAFRELEDIRGALTAGQLSMASSRVDALLKQYPTHAEALLLRAILHMQREQYREAEIAFTTALNQGANRKKCLMGIGMASLGRAYPQGAWQTFLRVLAENPDDADVIHWLLRAGTAQNRWRELSVQLHNFLARNPSDLSVRFAYAGVLLRDDQVDAARQEYNQLRALAPTYEGLVELGQAIAAKENVLALNVSNA